MENNLTFALLMIVLFEYHMLHVLKKKTWIILCYIFPKLLPLASIKNLLSFLTSYIISN